MFRCALNGSVLALATSLAAVPVLGQGSDIGSTPEPGQNDPRDTIIVTGYRAEAQVTATKTPLSIKETPQSISVATIDIIRDRGAQSLAEAMYFIPAIVSFNDGASGGAGGGGSSVGLEYNIRGVYDTGNLNATRIDGQRSYWRSQLDLSSIDRVEVLRGPATLFGGPMPPGGIINLIPKRARANSQVVLTGRIGSFDSYVLEGDLNGAVAADGQLQARVAALYVNEGSWVDFRSGERVVLTGAVGSDIGTSGRLDVTASWLRREFVEGGSFAVDLDGTIPDIPRSRFVGIPTPPSEQELSWMNLAYVQGLGRDWSIHIKGRIENGYNRQRGTSFRDYVNGFAAGDVSLDKLDRRWDFKTWSADMFLAGRFAIEAMPIDLVAGADMFDLSFDLAGAPGSRFGRTRNVATISIFNPDTSIDIGPFARQLNSGLFIGGNRGWGLYGQAILRPVAPLAIIFGLRRDDVKTFSGNAANGTDGFRKQKVTGRIGSTWTFDKTVTAYATFNQSFIPSSSQGRDGRIIAPETGYQVEGGIKTSLFDERFSMNAAVYHMVRNNVDTPDPENSEDEFFSVAAGRQVHSGVELEAVGTPIDGLQIVASLAWQSAKITRDNGGLQGSRPYDAPFHTAALFATYELQSGPLRGFGFGGSVRDVGKYFPFAEPQNSYSYNPPPILDAQFFYRGFNGWDIRLNIFNLPDTRYLNSVSIYGASSFGRPRSAILSVTRRL